MQIPSSRICAKTLIHPRVAEYVKETFSGTNVNVEVMEGQAFFEKEYPCLAAVNRAASVIPR